MSNEDFRFGSAAWANDDEIRRAGLFAPAGPYLGFRENNHLRLAGDGPLISFGGAGTGKLTTLLSYNICSTPGMRMLILDPRGELGAISIHVHAAYGDHAWFWNPMGLCGLPQHRCNPLDIIRLSDVTFHADCKFIAEGLIPLSGGANGKYFELRAREWLENLLKSLVEEHGSVDFRMLHRIVNAIEADPELWANQLETMMASRFESVRRVAAEILAKQQDTQKEFGAIAGELYAYLNFLDDPALLAALDEPDFSLAALCDPVQPCKIFLNIPAEYLGLWSPLIRLFFTVTTLYKSRVPQGPRVMLLVDEAGQLGKFEALLRAFTFGRGAGLRAWAVFQDAGQLVRNFDKSALQTFIGSAQMRQFFGVRDYETALLVSNMLGTETLEYDDNLQQDAARRRKWETVRSAMTGGDPMDAAYDYAHFAKASANRTKQARLLMTPDEILAMPEDRQILFISGKNLRPIYGHRYSYFTRREMAGRYLPNPYHPPLDSVPVATWLGSRRVPIVTEPVPPSLRSFPQHRAETWSYVKGYRPL